MAAAVAAAAAAFEALQVLYPEDIEEFLRAEQMFQQALVPYSSSNEVVDVAALWGELVATDIITSREDDGHDADEPFKVRLDLGLN